MANAHKLKYSYSLFQDIRNEISLKLAFRVFLITPIVLITIILLELFLGLGYQKMTIEQPHLWGFYTGAVEELFYIFFIILFYKFNDKHFLGAILFYRLFFLIIESLTIHLTAEEFIFIKFLIFLGYKFIITYTVLVSSYLIISILKNIWISSFPIFITAVSIHSIYNWSIAKYTHSPYPSFYIVATIGCIGIILSLILFYITRRNFRTG